MRNLAQMTSGYADYVYQQELLQGLYLDPFRQFTPQELIHIGVSKPMEFAPGTNWGYSHTNYVILGQVLQKIAGMPLADALRQDVLEPMGLKQTTESTTPMIPQPVLHAFTSERREVLGIKPGVPGSLKKRPFGIPRGPPARDRWKRPSINDLSASIEAVAAGKLLSPASSAGADRPESFVGFGHKQPNCNACMQGTAALNYGLGVILSGAWVTQTLGFAGASGVVAYLPQQKLTIAVEATNAPGAYDATGGAGLGAVNVYRSLATAIAPNSIPATTTH